VKSKETEVPTDREYVRVLVNKRTLTGRRDPKGGRVEVRALVLHRNPRSVVVRLPDGAVVKRRVPRDVPKQEGG
jgi:hypothetical protein